MNAILKERTGGAGFTLVEVIAALVIAGILAVVAGMGVVSGVRAYLQAKDNAIISQKAEVALGRIDRELRELTNITGVVASPPSITYSRFSGATELANQTIALSGTTVTLNGDVLVDGLVSGSGFALAYYKGSSTWAYGTDATSLLSVIQVTLTMTRSDGTQYPFITRVTPRNNGNAGGAPPPSNTNPPAYQPCFVATAAFGHEDHPVVWILREFRDRILLQWSAGRTAVDWYYSKGPLLADMIRPHPWACLVVQLFLAPLAGWAFLLLYHPVLLPVLLLLSWWMVCLPGKILRHLRQPAGLSPLETERGSILIGLVVTMVIVAILGTSLLTLNWSSSSSQFEGYGATRAYYLAEAGYRFAASRFFNAGTTSQAKFQMLETLNAMNGANAGKVGTSGADGTFQIWTTPYFMVLNGNHNASVSSLSLKYPGSSPDSAYALPSSGAIDINTDNNIGSVNKYTYTRSGNTFTISPVLATAQNDYTSVRYITNVSSATTVNQEGSLTVSNAAPFPSIRGTFKVNQNVYAYRYKSGNTLYNVTGADSPATGLPLTLATTDNILCNEFVELRSRGETYSGNAKTGRSVTYYTPIGFINQAQSGTTVQEFTDSMSSLANWHDPNLGSAAIVTDNSNKAMRLSTGSTGFLSALSTGYWGLIAQKGVDFSSVWNYAGYLLDYDAQVKVKTGTLTRYLAGIGFRLQDPAGGTGDIYSYGLTFLCSSIIDGVSTDGIPDGLIPDKPAGSGNYLEDKPLVVLWKRTSAGFSWMAYKRLRRTISLNKTGTTGPITTGTYLRRSTDTCRSNTSPPCRTAIENEETVSGNSRLLTIPQTDLAYFQGSVGGTLQVCSSSCNNNANFINYGTVTAANDQLLIANDGILLNDWSEILVRIDEQYNSGTSGPKSNLIRSYYANPNGQGTANTVPTDDNRATNPRWMDNTPAPLWPPDDVANWAAANDNYTLIKWEGINTGIDNTVGTGTEAGCVIKDSSLLTPSSGTFTSAEVGLLASRYGTLFSPAVPMYFDDFALRYTGPASSGNYGFLNPIQQ